jgi:hypothetical protein
MRMGFSLLLGFCNTTVTDKKRCLVTVTLMASTGYTRMEGDRRSSESCWKL